MATPIRTIRVPDELWERAQDVAREQGTALSLVIRDLLEEWLTQHP